MWRLGLDVLLLDESETPSSQVAKGRTFPFTQDSGNERDWECVCLQDVRCDKGTGVVPLYFKFSGDFFLVPTFCRVSIRVKLKFVDAST